ncbi:hypothetical protein HDU99_001977, partial [Rhizoclosmatium hyalinum]
MNVPTWLPLPVKSAKYGTLFEQRIRHKYWKAMKEPSHQHKERISTLKNEAKSTIVVTYAIRKSETVHGPSPIGSIFGSQFQGPEGTNTTPPIQAINGTEPELFRKVKNEVELIRRIQTSVNQWASPLLLSSRNVEFRAIDFATLSFDDQIAIAQGTDVFIGPHGAVFAYLMYLRKMPVAGVVELKPPERGFANQHEWIDPDNTNFTVKAAIPPGKSNFSIAFPVKGKYWSGASIEMTNHAGLLVQAHQ